jgi:uncharacterized protein
LSALNLAGLRRWLALGMLLAWAGVAAAKGPLYLWEVADGRGNVRAWLYGTIHVCDAACFPLPAPVSKALAAADSLALELDPEDPALGPGLASAAMLPSGRSLNDMLPADLRPRLATVLGQVGLPVDAAQRMQPWMVSTLLTLRAAQIAGYDTEQGVDLWLARAARSRGQPLWALETVERQIEALGAGGEAAQVASLVEVVELIERKETEPYFRSMLDAWRRGNAEELDRLMREEATSEAMAPMLAELLDSRNREMADAISARLKSGKRPFIAVGAGHFGGANGLLAVLAGKGFRVRQVEDGGE